MRIGTLHDGRVLVVHHVFRPDDSYQVLQVGSLLPLHATALGKALLAANPYVLSELVGEELTRFTPCTITDAKQLGAALKEVKRRGWAADIGELVDGEVSVAAPITDRSERTVGSIAISGPIDRLCESELPRADLVAYVRKVGAGHLPRPGGDPVVAGPGAPRAAARELDSASTAPETGRHVRAWRVGVTVSATAPSESSPGDEAGRVVAR